VSKRRSLWGTRFGFYLAAIGSAFGLGNLWRFPYVTAENGGGAFVLLYTFFALLIGMPLLVGELMLGKLTRKSAIGAMKCIAYDTKLSEQAVPWEGKRRWPNHIWVWFGRAAVFTSMMVLAYYAVISGWVLHFLMQFLFGPLMSHGFDADTSLAALRGNGILQVALTSVHLLITIIVVVRGVQAGIEKWVGNVMPVFVVLLALLVFKSMSLPTSTEALRFLFYPDFSKLTSSSMIHALGHVFFTLSIGFGTMITFGSYLNENTHIPSAGFKVTTMDTMISLFAGLLIFPMALGAAFSQSGPEVLFRTLPRLLQVSNGGYVYGVAFFLCLYLASLGASIGLLESIVSNWMDDKLLSRQGAAWMTGIIALFVALVPALSTSVFKGVSYNGHGLLELIDAALINGFLPLIALGFTIAVSFRLRRELKKAEFVNDDSMTTIKLYGHWITMTSWIAPTVIVIAFLVWIFG
jgi:NSS family neurotransmitter:Na+ symporter